MLLGPGKNGYELTFETAARGQIDRLFEEYPSCRFWWSGVEDLLRTSGHIVGQSIRFRGRGHRILSFSAEPGGLHPAIDLIYIIIADELTVDFVEMNIRKD
ncbi:MAG: hypothetical protein ACRC7G_02315 [Beijerinckiaceae bacterium]